MVAARPPRRAAGVRFEVVPPPLPQALPRMDVAVFVGFTASGPLHIPVVVEDPTQLASIFGSDAPLAWDGAEGGVLNAYLAPAVRAFFLNGGRRCWVIRVAGGGVTNEFPIPGMLLRSAAGDLQQATVLARSQGSWSDDMSVSSALSSRPLAPGPLGAQAFPAFLDVVMRAQDDVVAGDLMRLTFYDDPTGVPVASRVAHFVVASLGPVAPTGPAASTTRLQPVLRADGTPDVTWFRTTLPAVPLYAHGALALGGTNVSAWLVGASGGTYQVRLDALFSDAPPAGTTLSVAFGAEQLWMTVTGAIAADVSTSPPMPQGVTLSGAGFFVDRAPAATPSAAPEIERLQLALTTRAAADAPATLENLGFDPSHPRAFWGLPSDEELFRGADDTTDADARAVALRSLSDVLAPLWSDASEPRFDLAASGDPNVTFFPVGMPYTPDYSMSPLPTTGTALERDGLASFDPTLFLDPDLGSVDVLALMAEANFIRYQSSEPRRWQGIHAALGIDEATLIAVPDAALPGWQPSASPAPPPGAPAEPSIPGADGSFVSCALRSLALPAFHTPIDPDANGTFLLSWDAVGGADTYEVQESSDPQFGQGVVTYTTTDTQIVVYGHCPGYFYVRAQALAGQTSSGWSAATGVAVGLGSGWVVPPEASPPQTGAASQTLSTVQSALLKMCAARGDLFGILALPESQSSSDAAAYVSALCANQSTPTTLGYAAAYHPWLVVQDAATGPLRTIPPDGVIAGIFARRTLGRGAWVAPANEPLAASVLGLSPRAPDDAWAVLDAQPVNRIREEARGLMNMSADTLTGDPDFTPINVRRLLMLLRRAALSLGNAYVFEPNGDQLARAVEGTFTSLLESLYQSGALAGATSSDAYRVVTDATVNPPGSVDLGRFIVELQVAPSRPLAFLTVRLVQTGDQFSVSSGS